MTLILELPPETEARLRATALARGVAVEDAVREALNRELEKDEARWRENAVLRARAQHVS